MRVARLPLLSALVGALLWHGLVAAPGAWAASPEAEKLYDAHCVSCHGAKRLGGSGPALLPESFARLAKHDATTVIANGRKGTQMPAFSGQLATDEIAALVEFVYSAPAIPPVWGEAEIKESRRLIADPMNRPAKPKHTADPLNLFVVVESGDHHATILDGDRFEPLARFATPYAVHGGPKFSPDGRYVYFVSRDGWVMKYDLHALEPVAEIRAGLNSRNIAISDDGRFLAVGNYLPHTLVLLDAVDLTLLKVIPVRDARGKSSSRVSAVYQAAPRHSFIVALKDMPELWEVSYAANPPKTFGGLVHSYEKGMEEAIAAETSAFPIRRTELKQPLDDFFFDPSYRQLIGSARDGEHAVVVHLDVRREIAELPLSGLPHLGSGISWMRGGRRVMATPHLKDAAITVIDMATWQPVRRIDTTGPGFFLRSHEESRYAWADSFNSPKRDVIHVIDKETLEIVRTLRPAPGRTAAHVEFTRDGRYALVSIWEMDGAIVVYDAVTLNEVRRIPFVKPSGKYNVYNKTRLSEGTSH
jgi:mono/diheme cytochrome c family protein